MKSVNFRLVFGGLFLASAVFAEPSAEVPKPDSATPAVVAAPVVTPPALVLPPNAEAIAMPQFDGVVVYGTDKHDPSTLAIVLTGDGSIDPGFVKMLNNLMAVDTMFVVVKTLPYLKVLSQGKDSCYNPAADLQSLSHFIQQKYHFTRNVTPTLIGYSSGATLAYAILGQAPENTFRGVISLGFCPDLEVDRPLCPGAGLKSTYRAKTKSYWMARNKDLKHPWFVLNGTKDTVCDFKKQKAFVKGLHNATLVPLKNVGHGFDVARKWVPQYKKAFESMGEPNLANPVDVSTVSPSEQSE